MSRLLAETVKVARVKSALKDAGIKADLVGFVTERLNDLLNYIRRIELDIEADKAGHIAGKKPQDRRAQFLQLAAMLDKVSEELSVFKAPQRRYQENKDFPRTKPLGMTEFRKAMANQLTQPLSAEFIGTFGGKPIQWDPANVSLGPINTWNRAFTIETFAESISVDLLHRLATALREAERDLAANTPRGGPRRSQIRDTLLINIVALWEEIHDGKKVASYNRGKTNFFIFCQVLSSALGGGNLCTEAHLRKAVEEYKRLKSTKNPPLDYPEFPTS